MPPQEISKLWVMIIDEYQDIENIEDFYDYVTNTWIDDDALFDYILWNYYDFKSSTTNNHLEGCHHRLNNDLNNVVHPHFYLFILAIPNDYAYNSPISSRHLATGNYFDSMRGISFRETDFTPSICVTNFYWP
ncbi:unnamed protein product [Rotaria sp. Silwood2]|nr:unnamed protein product [Rotaria sp. Silwood2]